MSEHEDAARIVHTDGGVSAFTGEAFVTIRVGAESGQWSPAQARAFALLLVRTAEAAETDADVLRVLSPGGQGHHRPEPAAVAMVTRLRELREERDRD